MKIERRNREGYTDPMAYEAMANIRGVENHRLLVYICSPYSGDVKANVKAARKYCRYAVDKGYMPIAPHLLFRNSWMIKISKSVNSVCPSATSSWIDARRSGYAGITSVPVWSQSSTGRVKRAWQLSSCVTRRIVMLKTGKRGVLLIMEVTVSLLRRRDTVRIGEV